MSIAKAMRLPTKGSVEETRLIIEGSRTDMDWKPRYIQVDVMEDDSGKVTIYLRDFRGTFMETYSNPPDARGAGVEEWEVDARDNKGGSSPDEVEAESEDEATTAVQEALARNTELQDLNNELSTQVSMLEGEISTLADKLKRETERVNEVWRMSCEQVSAFDWAVSAKDAEINSLRATIVELETSRLDPVAFRTHSPCFELSHAVTYGPSVSMPRPSPHLSHVASRAGLTHSTSRRYKVPPVCEFTSDDPDFDLEDWLPSL